MLLMEGKTPSHRIREWVRRRVQERRTPLGVFRLLSLCVGEDPASEAYRRNQIRACEAAGIETATVRLPEGASEAEARDLLLDLNADETVDGVILQTPLPPDWDLLGLREGLAHIGEAAARGARRPWEPHRACAAARIRGRGETPADFAGPPAVAG